MSGRSGQRIHVGNPADGGVLYWTLKLYGFSALVGLALLAVTGVAVYGYFANRAPPAPRLSEYALEVPGITRIRAFDGTLLAEFADQRRELVAYEDVPEALVDAFLAAEDHQFFDHHGLYFRGIARAAWRNVVAGDFAQGGSTITQQVAKQFLGREKSLTRKAKEAILARRLESRYSKEAILSLYMNHIYLGSGSYGVVAAAERYFSKDLGELDVGEMAVLAGLAQAPSYYSPLSHPERARQRRDEILDKMVRHGFVTADEAAARKREAIDLDPSGDVFGDRHPYYAEHARRYLIDAYGEDRVMEGGLRVETAVQPAADAAAYENVDYGARKQDKRQGWRGPVAYLDGAARETFLDRSAALYGDGALEPERRYLALVTRVRPRRAEVRVGGGTYEIALDTTRWASEWSRTEFVNDVEIENLRNPLEAGHVVWVRKPSLARGEHEAWILANRNNPHWLPPRPEEEIRDRRRERWEDRVVLEQAPHPQSAIFTGDHETGYVVAMVGGTDFGRSEYNRAMQACRQPGSTYKPIYYSKALDIGFGYDTLLNDVPRVEIDEETGSVWLPENFGGQSIDPRVTLEYALVFSKNLPSVDLFKRVGADEVEAWARELGFTTEIIADRALALGASCALLHELTRAFAIFARNGRWTEWVTVRRVFDREGVLLEDHTVYYDPMLSPAERLDRLQNTAGVRAKQAIPARAAFLMSKLLRKEVQHGFASIIRRTGVRAAGKTGTSSATMDTTFVGYTSRWITSVWLGDDLRVRPLGRDDAAYKTVVPMWARYMARVASDHPNEEIPWTVPEGVNRRDRGGDRGEQAEEPMPLVWRSKGEQPDDPADDESTDIP